MPGHGGYFIMWAGGVAEQPSAHRPVQDRHVGRCVASPTTTTEATGLMFHSAGPYFSLKFIIWYVLICYTFSSQENS